MTRAVIRIRIESKEQVLGAFRELDHPAVEVPDWVPGTVLDFMPLTWSDASGENSYVLIHRGERIRGLRLRRGVCGRPGRAEMCQWCKRVASGSQLAFFTVRVTQRRSFVVPVCRGLKCEERLLEQRPPLNAMVESLDLTEKRIRYADSVRSFVHEVFSESGDSY